MARSYNTYVAALASAIVESPTGTDFLGILPDIIDYAEQRIYRDLDLLATVSTDTTQALVVGSRQVQYPSGRFVTIVSVNVVVPVSAMAPDLGTRNPLVPTSRAVLDATWGAGAPAALPQYFAMLNDRTFLVGPWPDQAYPVETVGTARPAPLSAANPTTFLTLYLPDLFLAASMIFASGWQQNFGSQSDNPQMAVSWSAQYDALLASAGAEEMRRKFYAPKTEA